jgi:hypothetical protein
MIMADILLWTLIILGTYLVLVAYWLGAYALFPALVERCRASYGVRPVASTLLGLVILLPTIAIAAAVTNVLPHPLVKIPLIGALLVIALLCLIGSAGLALRIGAGMASPLDATQPWRRLLRGGMVLGLAFVMPFLGWFVLLPWTLTSGLGALVLSRRATAPVLESASIERAPVTSVPVES